jgi:hypothetical protein
MKAHRTFRKGFILYFLICIIGVVGIFSLSMQYFVSSHIFQTRKLLDSQATAYLLRSAVACALSQVLEKIEETDSDLNKSLIRESFPEGTSLQIDTSALNDISADFRGGKAGVEVTLLNSTPVSPEKLTATTGGFDAVERACELKIKAWATCGGTNRFETQIRTMKIVNLNPGVFGKFAFYLKHPESEDAFNVYSNNINGWEDDRVSDNEQFIPIVFNNGGVLDDCFSTTEDSWKERGFIYLGGKVTLNLTAGDDERYGESFHFGRLNTENLVPNYYPTEQPKTFSNPPDFSENRYPTQNTGSGFAPDFALGLKALAKGYFTADGNNNNMNLSKRLDTFFSASSNDVHPEMRSSILHLFGNNTNPSPTLVLGEVNRRYAEYMGIILEYTGNTNRDAFLAFLPNKKTGNLANMMTIPAEVSPHGGGDLPSGTKIQVDTMFVNLESMFDTLTDYYESACALRTEPYLRGHDFLYHQDATSFHPQTSSFGAKEAECQQTFSLNMNKSLGRDSPFFENGKLDEIPEDFLEAKTVFEVNSVDELAERFQDSVSREWSLNAPVLVVGSENSTSELPADFSFNKGGLLVFENGNVKISQIQRKSDPDQVMTICALNGNIELDLSKTGTIQANLMAPRGRLTNLTSSRALDVEGSIIVSQFPYDSFPAGGKLSYNKLCDPSGKDYPKFYRAYISDLPFFREGG